VEEADTLRKRVPMRGTAVDLASYEREVALNRQAYERLRAEIHQNHSGEYIALGQGRLLAAGPTFDETMAAVRRMPAPPEFALVFPADEEPPFEAYYAY